ncbi:MAG: class I SAM-dependent methyltransferase [Candidatus Aminicenantes bacterium]|nr:class I SAM-dependent methyltransferase [Candidatus Aminicenantes bacterium]
MFNNLFNIHDLSRLFEKIKEGQVKSLLKKITGSRKNRITDSWKHTQSPPVNWENIPAVKERLNTMVSGNAAVNHRSYIIQTYLQPRKNLTALSLGCGTGQNEIAWAETGIFKRIDAFDISENRILRAVKAAAGKECDGVVKFSVSDALKQDIGEDKYDLVFFEGSLHHFFPAAEILRKASRSLKHDGYVVVYDFVGPTRFQWRKRQLEIADSLLTILPDRYKRKWNNGALKTRVYRPGRLFMTLSDPSEAAESAEILPCLRHIFNIVEIKEMGGTILHLLFNGIAHHFRQDDPETRDWLNLCFTVEDLLIKTKEITSDFVLAVCGKKSDNTGVFPEK